MVVVPSESGRSRHLLGVVIVCRRRHDDRGVHLDWLIDDDACINHHVVDHARAGWADTVSGWDCGRPGSSLGAMHHYPEGVLLPNNLPSSRRSHMAFVSSTLGDGQIRRISLARSVKASHLDNRNHKIELQRRGCVVRCQWRRRGLAVRPCDGQHMAERVRDTLSSLRTHASRHVTHHSKQASRR